MRRIPLPAKIMYGAILLFCLVTYVSPLQQILESKLRIASLETKLSSLKTDNSHQQQLTKDLNTPAGIERAARERYGMIFPGEQVYIIPKN